METLHYLKKLSIAVMVLGSIHLCATPIVMQTFKMIDIKNFLMIAFMFVSTGLALVFTGWLQYQLLNNGLKSRHELKILRTSIAFIALSGLGAVATMWSNPFAYLNLLLALCEVILINNNRTNIETTA